MAIINKGALVARGTMDEVLGLYDPAKQGSGYRGSKLEEVFLQLTKDSPEGEASTP